MEEYYNLYRTCLDEFYIIKTEEAESLEVAPEDIPCSHCGDYNYLVADSYSLSNIACILKSEGLSDFAIKVLTGYKVTVNKEKQNE